MMRRQLPSLMLLLCFGLTACIPPAWQEQRELELQRIAVTEARLSDLQQQREWDLERLAAVEARFAKLQLQRRLESERAEATETRIEGLERAVQESQLAVATGAVEAGITASDLQGLLLVSELREVWRNLMLLRSDVREGRNVSTTSSWLTRIRRDAVWAFETLREDEGEAAEELDQRFRSVRQLVRDQEGDALEELDQLLERLVALMEAVAPTAEDGEVGEDSD